MTHGSITSVTPSSGATNVALNTNVVVQFNKAVDPLTINATSIEVFDNTASGNPLVPGTLTVSANQQTVTFAQALPFEPGHKICVYLSYQAYVFDLSGNSFNYATECFTAGAGTDTIAPTVLSVTPADNATGIGPNNPVMVTFSKSMNQGTLTNNVAIYKGSTLYTSSYSVSNDNTTIIFSSGNLPFTTTFTVVVNPDVTDLAGNALGTEFTSTFTTGPAPAITQPQVTAMRPASGATGVSAGNPITFFLSAPLNPATVTASTLIVTQNGLPVTGSINIAADNQDVTFTPATSFAGGAIINVFFTNGVHDPYGNPLVNFQSAFTVAPDLMSAAPTILSYQVHFCSNCLDPNGSLEMLFSKPMNIATLTSANLYLSTSSSGTPLIPANVTLLDGGRLVRLKPVSTLAASTYYYVFAKTAIQDTTGLSFAGGSNSYLYYAQTTATSDTSAPTVTASAPTNGSTAIGANAVVSVNFSENVDQLTLDPSNVTLTGPGGSIPVSIGYNSSSGINVMTVTPQSPLPRNANVSLTINNVFDLAGNALNPSPFNDLTFATGPGPDYNPPIVVSTNIQDQAVNVPVTTGFSMVFDKPIDFRTVILSSTIYFQDQTLGYPNVAATVAGTSADSLVVTPTVPLSVNHVYRILERNIADLNGNVSAQTTYTFTTVLTASPGGPVVTRMIPVNGTTVPVDFSPMVQFDRAISPQSLDGVTLMQGGNPVAASPQLTSGGTVLTLATTAILKPGASYTFTVAGVKDSAGNTMTGSVSRAFTTGTGIDITNPVITVASPIYNGTTGTNPEVRLTFNEQINPITSGTFSFYDVAASGIPSSSVNGAALNWASDYKSVEITYPGSLNPGSRYYFVLNSVCNLAAYCVSSSGTYFYTSQSTDNTPETISSVSVSDGATGVPLNPAITLHLSKAAAPGSVTNSSVTLSPASVAEAVSLSSDAMTITLSLGGNLQASTLYTISVPGGAFTDIDGNAVSGFSSTFTTGTSAENTSVHGTISMTNPAPGASGIAITSAVTLTFSEPYNPNSITSAGFELFANNQNATQIAGTISMPTSNTLVFTPAVALPPNVPIYVYAGYNASITDYAGVTFQYLSGGANAVFTTANTADNTPPQVISMSPGVNATNVGPYSTVSLTFSKSLSVSTINSSNFALYQGSTQLSPGIAYSSDHRTVNLNTTLPYGATIEVAVNTSVQDYAGNNMASPYQATFTTLAAPVANGPSEIQSRPGSNAGLNVPVTIFMNGPMNLASVQAGLQVAQNGALISGNVTLTADLHGITWTPSSPYLPGALIEVYLTSIATDTSGNPASSYKFSFTTQAQSSPPTEVSVSPGRNTQVTFTNPVVEIQFSEPLDPATVTSSTFVVSTGSGTGGAVIPGTLSLLSGNTIARFTPAAPFPVNQYFHISLTTGIKDMSANAFAGDSYYVFVTNLATLDNTPPTLTAITPVNGSTSIGDNAPVRLVFSKVMDTLSINSSTVLLLNGATQLPWTATFSTLSNPSRTVATLQPEAPLPDGDVISVHLTTGVNDQTGSTLADQTPTFTTMSGADFSAPYVIERSISDGGNTNVPTSATFTWVFNKPLDPTTVIGNPNGGATGYFYVYDSAACASSQPCYPAVNVNVSSDGRTVTLIPAANLAPNGTNDHFYANYATDLNGNVQTGAQQQFLTAATTTVTGPTIIGTNPLSTNGNPVPTNTSIEVIFSKPVSQISLGHITLTGGANAPYSVIFDNTYYTDDSVIRIVPQSLLLPNTTYTVNVTGVTDVAGNLADTTTFAFTTGNNFQGTGLYLTGATVTTGPSTTVPMPLNTTVPGVLDNPTFTLTFDHQIDLASLGKWGSITLRNTSNTIVSGVTLNFNLSSDQKTVTVTTSGLAAATTYHLWVAYGVNPPLDISGNYYSLGTGQSGNAELPFTTQ
jgi:methionine-rich copper-binding protein CopC